MARVPVPEDYDADAVPLPSSMDYDDFADAVSGHAGRRALVREDEAGRHVGVHEDLVGDVVDYLGVSVGDDGADAGTCQEVKSDGEVCGRDLPCPYHSDDGDGGE